MTFNIETDSPYVDKNKDFQQVRKRSFKLPLIQLSQKKAYGGNYKRGINFPRFEISKPIFLILQLKSFSGARR
jgi:hypothetical protein